MNILDLVTAPYVVCVSYCGIEKRACVSQMLWWVLYTEAYDAGPRIQSSFLHLVCVLHFAYFRAFCLFDNW